jgi:hypothetical protein
MPGMVGEIFGKVAGGLARGSAAKSQQQGSSTTKSSSLKQKAKKRNLWPENLRHYQLDILDKPAKHASGPVRGMIFDLLRGK